MPDTQSLGELDFDLHGIVGIRLVDASPGDAEVVRRQLGDIQRPLTRQPDITCRFVNRLSPRSPVRLIGLDDAGFTDDAYLVLRSKHKASTRVQIPMTEIGGRCEIVCESGVPAIPLLIAIINLTALARGYAPIHASAAVHRDRGVLIAGWAKGGKTELLLGFMAAGAEYVGDEWIYLAPGGTEMYGIPEPMKIWSSHLEAMPRYRARLGSGERVRLAALGAGAGMANRAAALAKRSTMGRALRRGAHVAAQQAYVHVPPSALFGSGRCRLNGPIGAVVLALSGEEPDVRLEPASGVDLARRMTHSVQHERLDLLAHYLKFRFAFPGARNPLLDDLQARQSKLLEEALADKPAAILTHPYPAPIPAMFAQVDEWLR